jgi:hypothetical protein
MYALISPASSEGADVDSAVGVNEELTSISPLSLLEKYI